MAEKFTYEQLMERGGRPVGGAQEEPQGVEQSQGVEEIHERNLRAMGIDTEGLAKRGAIAPVGFTHEGERVWAVPQFILDMARPAAVMEAVRSGTEATPEDVTRAALDYVPAGRTVTSTRAIPRSRYIEEAPARDEIRQQATRQYKRLESDGIAVSPESAQALVDNAKKLSEGKFRRKSLYGNLQGVVNEWQDEIDAGRLWTLQDIEEMRREAGDLAGAADAAARNAGMELRDVVDDYIESLTDADLIAGENVENAAERLTEARGLWRRQKKLETIEDVFTKAQNQASGFENGLRVQFRQIINNPKRRRQFDAEEIQMMERIVRGGPVQNALRWASKWGMPVAGSNRALGSGLSAGAGAAVAGPIGAAATVGAGTLAGEAARRGAVGQAELLEAMIARGERTPSVTAPTGSVLRGAAGPVLATQIPSEEQARPTGAIRRTPSNIEAIARSLLGGS